MHFHRSEHLRRRAQQTAAFTHDFGLYEFEEEDFVVNRSAYLHHPVLPYTALLSLSLVCLEAPLLSWQPMWLT
jgi:hypothetical protein